MKKIITIGRQFGSGGREVGQKIAQTLHIAYYDKELLAVAAKKSGLSSQFMNTYDEKPTRSFLYSLVMGQRGLFPDSAETTVEQLAANAQRDAILAVAGEGSCVIVGRCADHVLAGTERLVRIFIYADMEARIQRIREKGYYEEHEIARNIRRMDRERRDYHRYYTGKEWENVENYDMMLNSGVLGTDGCVECILSYLKIRGLYPA